MAAVEPDRHHQQRRRRPCEGGIGEAWRRISTQGEFHDDLDLCEIKECQNMGHIQTHLEF